MLYIFFIFKNSFDNILFCPHSMLVRLSMGLNKWAKESKTHSTGCQSIIGHPHVLNNFFEAVVRA